MGWELTSNGKPQMYRWTTNADTHIKEYKGSNPSYYTWAVGSTWYDPESEDYTRDAAIKYVNDTSNPMTIGSISIKHVACDSNGKGYWASTGWQSNACEGWGAIYQCFVRVSNDGGNYFESSGEFSNEINSIRNSGGNMNSPGSSTTRTAVFGNPPYTGDKALQLRNYTITNCPIIQPGGIAYVHFRVTNNGHMSDTTIRFILNPSEMVVQFEPGQRPYVWRFENDNQWHLKRPIYVYRDGAWVNVEGEN